ncbi:hypothetical protein DK847_04345 [Aestuariivirga litoralis]|uniref:Membrane transport protein MMPL domain-containing protein n=1 Tax=Aestuariivirga litoralis TaxID=2650924 RepID=A0A2W2AVE4_9HYPH|nr:hypothetical protein [Aestuariivirga litoralis]PZF77672.1 hypothetical protein DK847_04345 [Aestuariivirga litoralis]
MKWDQPHWSGKPQPSAGPRQKLRPNGFARLARVCASWRVAVVLAAVLLAAALAVFAATRLSMDPDQRPRIGLDPATAQLQADLATRFPGVEQTFLAIVSSQDPETARQQALALAAMLQQRKDLFLDAFVPGTGAFYDTNSLLYRDPQAVRQRVDALLQLEPLYHAMAAAPDMGGFAALVTEIGKAVEQGRSPPGLESMLLAASATIEAEVKGSPRALDWLALAGLDAEVQANRWYVLATPVPGSEPAAAAAARQAAAGMQGVSWLWPRRALASSPSELRDFVVPALLSALLTLVLLFAALGSLRQALAVMLSGAVTLSAAGAAAAALGPPLDGATWSFALAVLAPAIVTGGVIAVAFGQGRARGLAPMQAVMLAAHRQGGFVSVVAALFAVVWASWLLRHLPSLHQFSIIALVGCVAAWVSALTVLPAILMLTAPRQAEAAPHWLDEAMGDGRATAGRGALDIAAMVLLAAAVFSTVFLPAMRFGERQLPSFPPPQLETPDARGAVHILVQEAGVKEIVSRLSALPEVGAIRTAQQFLPPDAAAKVGELHRLAPLTAFTPAFAPPADDVSLQQDFADLQSQLTYVANSPSSTPQLREAALRLRRAIDLFVSPDPPDAQRVSSLEKSLFGGLAQVSALAQRLAVMQPPGVQDLEPQLLRRFVAEDGTWRIEVMPRSGTGELSFAAALRRAVPQATGEPLVSLVRNEMIHHEAILALATALLAAAVLVLAVLRSLRGVILSLAPAGAFITLTAAITVMLDISLNAAMLAGVSAAIAVLIACSMLVAVRLRGGGPAGQAHILPLRAVLLPPITLAGAAAPLVISSRPAVAELGASLAMLFLIVGLLIVLLVPALARWLDLLSEPAPQPVHRQK